MATLKELESRYPTGEKLCSEVARLQGSNEKLLLSFSTGKDCLAAWVMVRDHFKEIIPFYLYLVPGLEFVEKSLDYYEKVLGTRIIRLPAPQFYGMMNDLVYQPPERIMTIQACNWPKFDYPDVRQIIIEDSGLPDGTFYATGVRAPDSPMRMTAISKYGPITHSQNKFHPVWNWTKAKLVSELHNNGIKLPVDYRLFSRTWDSLDFRFLWNIKREFPEDFQRIVDWFPLVELEFSRYEFYLRNRDRRRMRRQGASEATIFQHIVEKKTEFNYL